MKIRATEIKLVPIEQIIPNSKNTNVHPPEQLEMLTKHVDFQGFRNPLVISNQSGFLVSGHLRLEMAKHRGDVKELPCMFQDFESPAMEFAYLNADNELAKWANTDREKVTEYLKEFPELEIEMLGFQDFEPLVIESLDPIGEDEGPGELPEVPTTKRGDVWILGKHRVMCGDSVLIDDVEKLMNGEKADMVFTDPPYNVGSDSKNIAASVSKSMNDLSNAEWDKSFEIEPPIINSVSFSKDSATYYVWTSHFLFNRIIEVLKVYCDFTCYLIWSKPNPMPSLSKRHPTWNMEMCVYGTRGTKRIVNFPDKGHFLACRTVVKKSDGSHPTQKPLELIEPLIEFSSGKGQLVLDLFLGSGSTLIACEKTNRKCFGMELDEKYVDVIINRWQKLTNKQAILESTGQTFDELKNKPKGLL